MDEIGRAKELEKQDRKAEAAERYLKASSDPDKIWAAAKAGELFFGAGDVARAKSAYRKIFGCGNPVLYDRLVEFYIGLKEYAEASEAFSLCYPYAPRKRKLALADRFFGEKAYAEAERWYTDAIDRVEPDKNPYFTKTGGGENLGFPRAKTAAKADGYYLRAEYRSALPLYERLSKRSAYAKTKSAECAFALGDFDKAKKYYRELVQETEDPYYMFMLAECYNSEEIDVNTLENAVYWYEYALECGCGLCYYHLGICYEFGRGTEENREKALEAYRKGAEFEVDRANCLCKLGNDCYRRGLAAQATEYYRKAAALDNPRALVNIAVVYFESRIPFFSYEEIRCFLAKAAALGSGRAYEMLSAVKAVNGEGK